MAGKRRTAEEISHVLAQAEAGVPIKELCRKYGVAEACPFQVFVRVA